MQDEGPSDSEGGGFGLLVQFVIDILAILAIICICCCCRGRKQIDCNQEHFVA